MDGMGGQTAAERPGSVGGRIREARQARRMTQDGLADVVGVSRSAVAQWETDRAGQVRGNLPRIAEALGVSVEYLLLGAGRQAAADASRAASGDELALLRLYRECAEEDRSFLLRTARKLAGAARA